MLCVIESESVYRAHQSRYVTELGFDVYSRFYQLPVTST